MRDLLLKYKLLIIFVLIMIFIASCHCVKPPTLNIKKPISGDTKINK